MIPDPRGRPSLSDQSPFSARPRSPQRYHNEPSRRLFLLPSWLQKWKRNIKVRTMCRCMAHPPIGETHHVRPVPPERSLFRRKPLSRRLLLPLALSRGKSASVPVSSVLPVLQTRLADSVPPSPAVVTVLRCLISPDSEPDLPRSKLRAGASLLTDSGPTLVISLSLSVSSTAYVVYIGSGVGLLFRRTARSA